ncbi:MAG TPA: hypothetical protein VKW08_02400 [Xanthobacteraceae bacterium]|nr:hypothetical protein [Xanthobacteraceae bacterium]
MNLVLQRINFDAPRPIVFAVVQLRPPALNWMKTSHVCEWDPVPRDLRITEVQHVLDQLFSASAAKKPDVVVFSEYSLPPEAHAEIKFQEFATRNRCVIIAGSYFNLEPEAHRHNICPIYLPDQARPLQIFKYDPVQEELGILLCDSERPNIARLMWEPTGREPVTISVFMCRDYLTPFKEQPGEQGDAVDRVSLLDWDHEGINIVVMLNDEPALFEGAAAFDVRLTRGKRRLVLLANSSNDQNRLATALFGPNPEKRDLVTQLPPPRQGVLMFEATLWDIAGRTEVPDKRVMFPIKSYERYLFSEDGALTSYVETAPTHKMRGIFHPAFLRAMEKCIVIELFVARSMQKIEKIFSEGKIDFVTACLVRGIEDILIRRYVPLHILAEWSVSAKGTIPRLSEEGALPYSRLLSKEFEEAFDVRKEAPYLRILIDPRGIKKFRGKPVADLDDAAWGRLVAQIIPLAHTQGSAQEIVRLATELPSASLSHIPEKYRFFFLGVEAVPVLGRETQHRDAYVLLSTEPGSLTRLNDFIALRVMGLDSVRDIFAIQHKNQETNSIAGDEFDYLFRLKCDVFDTDDFLTMLQGWADSAGVRIGTRTYDASKAIKRTATRGIAESMRRADHEALPRALFAIDPDFAIEDRELLERLAESLTQYERTIQGVPDHERRKDIWRDVQEFFCCICLFNSPVIDNRKKEDYADRAAERWTHLCKRLERFSRVMLVQALELPQRTTRRTFIEVLRKRFPEYFKEPRAPERGYLTWFSDLYEKILPNAPATLPGLVRQATSQISGLRNVSAHGGSEVDLEELIAISGEQWRVQLNNLHEKIEAICNLTVKFSQELHLDDDQ